MVSFEATIYRVLIASPGDLAEERDRIEKVVHDWNTTHAEADRVVLLPVRWETHAVPEYGARPQEFINRGIVADCDILIGAFWTRLGTPTGVSESGTVEEIEQFHRAGKPVLLYFSAKPINPNQVDWDQLRRVREFRTRLEQIALVAEFDSPADLQIKLTGHLHDRVRRLRSRSTKAAVQARTAADMAPLQQVTTGKRRPLDEAALGALYTSYWERFSEVLRRSDVHLRPPTPSSRNYARLSLRSSEMRLNVFASVRDRLIGVELVMKQPACNQAYSILRDAREQIEQALGKELEWNELPSSFRVVLSERGYDPVDQADWARQHEWLIEKVKGYQRFLLARLEGKDDAMVGTGL